jgi:hypothetical protein
MAFRVGASAVAVRSRAFNRPDAVTVKLNQVDKNAAILRSGAPN